MVQFLLINFFFLDFFNFCWVFQKFPFFCVTPYITAQPDSSTSIHEINAWIVFRIKKRQIKEAVE